MTDFSTPRRMNVAAFVIILLKSFREIFGISFIALAYMLYDSHDSLARDIMKAAVVLGGILAFSLLVAFSKYYFRKFHIEGDKLIFTHGFASKQTTSIPLSRVHTLRTKSGMVYRLLGLRGVAFDTLASDLQEVELILDETEWQMLLHRVSVGEDFAGITDDSIPLPPPVEDSTRNVSNLNIIKGALCQNHLKGFAILATVAFAVLDKINQFDDDATGRIIDYIDTHAGDVLPSVGESICFLAVIYLIVMALWTAKIALRYGNMTIRITDNRLTIESGLLSRFTCRIAREKATTLTIKQNPLEKLAHCQTVMVRQADNVSDTKKERDIRIYGSSLGGELLAWWLGDNHENGNELLMSAQSGKGLFMRRFIPHLILAAAAALILIHIMQTVLPAAIICSGYAAIAAVRAMMAWRHSRIELTETYVKINRGNIADIREYIKYRNIESVNIRSTPFTRATGRVSLQISTNAGATTISSLYISSAIALRNLLLNKCYLFSKVD